MPVCLCLCVCVCLQVTQVRVKFLDDQVRPAGTSPHPRCPAGCGRQQEATRTRGRWPLLTAPSAAAPSVAPQNRLIMRNVKGPVREGEWPALSLLQLADRVGPGAAGDRQQQGAAGGSSNGQPRACGHIALAPAGRGGRSAWRDGQRGGSLE